MMVSRSRILKPRAYEWGAERQRGSRIKQGLTCNEVVVHRHGGPHCCHHHAEGKNSTAKKNKSTFILPAPNTVAMFIELPQDNSTQNADRKHQVEHDCYC